MGLLSISICVFLWSDNELNKVLGKSTKVIDISSIVKPTEIIQIKNTNVLSEDCSHFIKNQDVIIKNGKIIRLGENQPVENNALIIDGTDKYLIPGLIDSHVHLKESKNDLFLYLVNGVTSIREMAGRPITLEWRKAIQKNGFGPRMFVASPVIFSSESGLTGYYYSWTRQSINYSTKDDAEKEIKKIKEQGYDAVKMYGFVNPEMFKTTIDISKKYNIPVIVPVNDKGVMTKEAGKFEGLFYKKANGAILEELKETGSLLASEKITHQYPHCWRCKNPIIFRATEQWFCSVEGFRKEAMEAVKDVRWIPAWGEDRITSMVRDRSDWCISRQRIWGVPIPIFYCKDCGKEIINDESIKAVADLFAKEGSNAWYKYEASEILPKTVKCECGCGEFKKETDIMDVWFDSGSSHAAVLQTNENLSWPADMYLEGNDQHRGWFQSSLLTSVATKGSAPYKQVLTHGYVVDGQGRKMSKSIGNGIDPEEIIKEYGADILRLWVASSDYTTDIRISKEILKQLSEVYRKIRNTGKYILGNISDFNTDTDTVSYDKMSEIDRWALKKLNNLIRKVDDAYGKYEFHQMYHAIHNFCVVDMSNLYLDIIKDRLYTTRAESVERRAAQTVMYEILEALVLILTPVLAFTSEEMWQYMPHKKDHNTESVQLNNWPKANEKYDDDELEAKWDKILALRSDVSKVLEIARASKVIGHSLNAKVTVYAKGDAYNFVKAIEKELVTIFIVSAFELDSYDNAPTDAAIGEEFDSVKISVAVAPGEKCERCWMYSETVGKDHDHTTLCERCATVLK